MAKPIPKVNIAEQVGPVSVVVEDKGAGKPGKVVSKGQGKTLTPNTTEEEDTVTAGQRRINLMWETTQSHIALMVVGIGMVINSSVIILIILMRPDVTVNQLALITVCFQFINLTAGIVIGFYFSRTNHTAVGGTGKKEVQTGQGTRGG